MGRMLPRHIPLTGAMTTFVAIVMFIAWIYATNRVRQSGTARRPVLFLNNYFLYMGLFSTCLSIPYIWVDNAARFSLAMAVGYVVGHIFCYIAFMYIARMVFALEPRLANKDRLVVVIWLLAVVGITIFNAKTMIWGVRPVFDHAHNLTEFNVNPIVGNAIVVMSVFSLIPAVILFGISTFKARGTARIKPLLLTLGFLIVMVAGPLHDVARSGTVYAAADFLSAVSMALLCLGVVYRVEHNLNEAPAASRIVTTSSNTV